MIEYANWLWLAAGLLGGVMHASALWRHVQQPTPWAPLIGLLRVAGVAALLVVAAVNGGILATAAGWALGFASSGGYVLVRNSTGSFETTASPAKRGD